MVRESLEQLRRYTRFCSTHYAGCDCHRYRLRLAEEMLLPALREWRTARQAHLTALDEGGRVAEVTRAEAAVLRAMKAWEETT